MVCVLLQHLVAKTHIQMMQNSCFRRVTASLLSTFVILQTCRGQSIDVSGCGESKGCFQVPEGCKTSCKFLLTWSARDKDSVSFEMSASVDSENSYVAFGLSKDAKMVKHRFLYTFGFPKN